MWKTAVFHVAKGTLCRPTADESVIELEMSCSSCCLWRAIRNPVIEKTGAITDLEAMKWVKSSLLFFFFEALD